MSRYDRKQDKTVTPPIPDSNELSPIVRDINELMSHVCSWPERLVGILEGRIERERAKKEVDDLIQSFRDLFWRWPKAIEENEFCALLNRCGSSLNSFRQSADLLRGRWSTRELQPTSDCVSVGASESDRDSTLTNGGRKPQHDATKGPSQNNGNMGDVPPDKAIEQERYLAPLTPHNKAIIRFLWDRSHPTKFTTLIDECWEKQVEIESVRRALERLGKKWTENDLIDISLKISKVEETVKLIIPANLDGQKNRQPVG